MNSDKPTLLQMANIMDDWNLKFHVDKLGGIIFQNKRLLSNVVFSHKSFHSVKSNPKGFENIPETIMNPTEVWAYWSDPKKQIDVCRNYISVENSYIVQTKAGVVTDAFTVVPSKLDRYRKGLPL
jgi:hypothetical protein